MGKPQGKVRIEWSPGFAYAIGLMVTDGNLSPDGRHIHFTSKDLEMIQNFHKALGISNKIGTKKSGFKNTIPYYVTQFSDVLFYRFLESIGLMPNKSKKLGAIKIDDRFFFDFLRGCFDGDGSTTSFWDKRWKSSFMLYLSFSSASPQHLAWLREKLRSQLGVSGHISTAKTARADNLRYAKTEALMVLRKIYYAKNILCLSRKRLKVLKALSIMPAR